MLPEQLPSTGMAGRLKVVAGRRRGDADRYFFIDELGEHDAAFGGEH